MIGFVINNSNYLSNAPILEPLLHPFGDTRKARPSLSHTSIKFVFISRLIGKHFTYLLSHIMSL